MTDFVTRNDADLRYRQMNERLDLLCDRVRELERLVPTLFAAAEAEASVAEAMSGEVFNSDDWRERLKRRGLDRLQRSTPAAAETVDLTARELAAFKLLGSLFNPAAEGSGPCYNRDAGDDEEGRDDSTFQA